MKRLLIALAVGFQLLALAWMAIERESVVRSGESFYLRTVPLDPRDLLRGDYVALNYEISQLDTEILAQYLPQGEIQQADRVYVLLEKGGDGIARLRGFSVDEPDQGLFIRGRAQGYWSAQSREFLLIKYGIEKYFVEQGQAEELESGVDAEGTSLEVEVAVGGSGTAVIKGHRLRE